MFPSSTKFHYPILLLLSDGKVHTRKEMMDLEIKMLNISDSDRLLKTPGKNGKEGTNKVWSWISYAITDLKQANYIIHSDNGYLITAAGKAFIDIHKDGFVSKELAASEAYRKYKKLGEYKKKRKSKTKPESEAEIKEDEPKKETKPDIDKLLELSSHINDSLASTLLDTLKKMEPKAFEHLIKELLIRMNIGESENCIELTQYVKDEGVDIYVYDNSLKMNVSCCIQIKRYNNAVGVSTVKELVGTLVDKNCKSGIVITTAQFTKGAMDFNPTSYNIRRIDGDKLTELLIQHGIGVQTQKIEVKTIDLDFLQKL